MLLDADGTGSASARLCPVAFIDSCDSPKTKNVASYFRDCVSKTSSLPNPADYISERKGTIHGEGVVDLLVGSSKIFNAEGYFAGKKQVSDDVVHYLVRAFNNLNREVPYDVVVVDCHNAPTVFVQGAVAAADLLVFPMIMKSASHWHYDSARKELRTNLEAMNFRIPPLLIVANKYHRSHANIYEWILDRLGYDRAIKIDELPKIEKSEFFNTETGATPKEKYGVVGARQQKALVSEVSNRLGLFKKSVFPKRAAKKKAAKKKASKKRAA